MPSMALTCVDGIAQKVGRATWGRFGGERGRWVWVCACHSQGLAMGTAQLWSPSSKGWGGVGDSSADERWVELIRDGSDLTFVSRLHHTEQSHP